MSKSYDLSISTKWANLADGEHVVKIRARGAGFGDSSFSNSVTVTKGVAMPVKGDLITIASKQYRVLKMNGSVAEVLAMYDASSSQVFGSSTKNYADSPLDTYCNQTFYGTLSASMQNAIVSKNFQQDSWYQNSDSSGCLGNPIYQGTYQTYNYCLGLGSSTFGASISRKCYVLSIQDVIDYLNVTPSMSVTDTTLTSENVWKMFWNQSTNTNISNEQIWLCSAYSEGSEYVFRITGNGGKVDWGYSIHSIAVRPAFQIDLSKITWSPVGGGN